MQPVKRKPDGQEILVAMGIDNVVMLTATTIWRCTLYPEEHMAVHAKGLVQPPKKSTLQLLLLIGYPQRQPVNSGVGSLQRRKLETKLTEGTTFMA